MTLPNFLLFGAGKAGTTSLYYYLAEHPDIFMSSIKEPRFFLGEPQRADRAHEPDGHGGHYHRIASLQAYEQLFQGARADAIGEASIQYMQSPDAAHRIRSLLPDVRLVGVLRNPVDRAFSMYLSRRRNGTETRDFTSILNDSKALHFYCSGGLYGEQLSHYYSLFPQERIRIFLYDDLSRDAVQVARHIYGFLGVDSGFRPNTALRANVSGVPRGSFTIGHYIDRVRRSRVKPVIDRVVPVWARRPAIRLMNYVALRSLDRPQLTALQRGQLWEYFEDDVSVLEKVLDQNLGAWRPDCAPHNAA